MASRTQSSGSAVSNGQCFQWLEGSSGPLAEARSLLTLVRVASINSVRDFIDVPPNIEEMLHIMGQHPEDTTAIEKVLSFRKRVREAFDQLVRRSGF